MTTEAVLAEELMPKDIGGDMTPLGDSVRRGQDIFLRSMKLTHGFTPNFGLLLTLACPTDEDTPFFNRCMREAKDKGLSWNDSLRYTIDARQRLLAGEVTAVEFVTEAQPGWNGQLVRG